MFLRSMKSLAKTTKYTLPNSTVAMNRILLQGFHRVKNEHLIELKPATKVRVTEKIFAEPALPNTYICSLGSQNRPSTKITEEEKKIFKYPDVSRCEEVLEMLQNVDMLTPPIRSSIINALSTDQTAAYYFSQIIFRLIEARCASAMNIYNLTKNIVEIEKIFKAISSAQCTPSKLKLILENPSANISAEMPVNSTDNSRNLDTVTSTAPQVRYSSCFNSY